MVSLSPTSVNIQTIVLGNILAITPEDTLQLAIIGVVSLAILLVKWKDLMVAFFDENHARSIGLNPTLLQGRLLHAAGRLHGGGAADGRRVPRHRHGGDAGRDRLSADRPLSAADRDQRRDRRASPASSAPMSATSSTARPAASSSCCRPLIFLAAFFFAPEARHARRPPPRGRGRWRPRHDRVLDSLLRRSSSRSCERAGRSRCWSRCRRRCSRASWCSRAGR